MTSKIFRVLRWIFGVIFALVGVGYLFSHVLAGMVCLAIAFILIPPTLAVFQKRLGKTIPRKYIVVALIVLLILLVLTTPDVENSNLKNINPTSQQEQASPSSENNQPVSPEQPQQEPVEDNTPSTAPVPFISPPPQTQSPSSPPGPITPKPLAPQENPPAVESQSSSSCDPNYSGCVPIASDVDCAGGSGNGPAYVKGPIQVIGYDKYDLDRNNDGIACE